MDLMERKKVDDAYETLRRLGRIPPWKLTKFERRMLRSARNTVKNAPKKAVVNETRKADGPRFRPVLDVDGKPYQEPDVHEALEKLRDAKSTLDKCVSLRSIEQPSLHLEAAIECVQEQGRR